MIWQSSSGGFPCPEGGYFSLQSISSEIWAFPLLYGEPMTAYDRFLVLPETPVHPT